MLKSISRYLCLAGLVAIPAVFWLHHLSETRMGVMRDLYVRNTSLNAILFAPVWRHGLPALALGCALFLASRFKRSPLAATTGLLSATAWIWVSLFPAYLGLAAPWMLPALWLLLAGCLLRTISA